MITNKKARSILGVTLLEIMLVLAIIAMIIVMSVRYYQSASNAQQAAAAFNAAVGINAAMDALSASSGDYFAVGGANPTLTVTNYTGVTTSPSGGNITVSATSGVANKFSVSMVLTTATCTTVAAQLNGFSKIKLSGAAAACTGTGNNTLGYTYDKTQ